MLTPEEWVRQHIVMFLISHKKYPASLLAVEKKIIYNGMSKRGDVVVYDRDGKAFMIVECKAPSVKISEDVFDQAAVYNMTLRVQYMLITNGIDHYCCTIKLSENTYTFLQEIPECPF